MVDRGSAGTLGADAEAGVNASAGVSRPIRVLHLRDSPWVDGPGRTILETAMRIDRARVDYHVGALIPDTAKVHPIIDALKARSLPVHAILDRGGLGVDTVRTIVGLIDRLGVEILHTSEFRSNVLGLMCRRQRPVRLVTTAHGWIANDLRGKVYTFVDRVLLRYFDQVILVSQAMRGRLPRWWVPDRRVRVIRNALMTDSYGNEIQHLPRRIPGATQEVLALNVGRLSPEKGQQVLLQAVAELVPAYPGLRLKFAGTGPLEAQLRREARRLGIAERVEFLGFINDMVHLYAGVDLVVQSSFTEGLPNVMLEASYLGVPIVATDAGGTREVVEHGKTGWLVITRSKSALAAGIRHFLEDPAAFRAMAMAGRARIESMYSIEERTLAQAKCYMDLASDPA